MPPAASSPPWQHLENIACAYWQSEALFCALRLELFKFLGSPLTVEELADQAQCQAAELARLLPVLETLELIDQQAGKWQNSKLAADFLNPNNEQYLGDFLLYRQYLQPSWQDLSKQISTRQPKAPLHREQSYEDRNFHYVQALDALSKIKAKEICDVFRQVDWQPPILDIGGGAGALSRALLKAQPGEAYLFELPEVISAARKIYTDPQDWQNITTIDGDFRSHSFANEQKFGLIIIGNFLHTYAPLAARQLLKKALGLTAADGIVLIHDYFADQQNDPLKGQLYDINMMLNTYDGHCHKMATINKWLGAEGWQGMVYNLPSDSALLVASQKKKTANVQ